MPAINSKTLFLRQWLQRYGWVVLLLIHAFGILTIVYWDRAFYARFTPLNLVLSTVLLSLAIPDGKRGLASFLTACFLLGYAIEWVGIHTGWPFGLYHYGPSLAPLLSGVPVIIGLNWFLLSLASGALADQIFKSRWAAIPAAAALMTGLDIFIEPVAPLLDFWHWEAPAAPWQNYLAWFLFSVLLQFLRTRWLSRGLFPLAIFYFAIVWLFFMYLNLAL